MAGLWNFGKKKDPEKITSSDKNANDHVLPCNQPATAKSPGGIAVYKKHPAIAGRGAGQVFRSG